MALLALSVVLALCVTAPGSAQAKTIAAAASWRPTLIDNPRGGLLSLSCGDATTCIAVDSFGNSVAERSGAWSRPVRVAPLGMLSVSCPTSSFCAAVGPTFAATYDGTTWSVPVAVETNTLVALDSVSCAAPNFCIAVDTIGQASTYNGSTWSPPKLVDANGLTSVSCPSNTACLAIDGVGAVTRYTTGAWHAPVAVLPASSQPAQISCATTTFCEVTNGVAAGTYDGTTWSEATLPFTSPEDEVLLSCPSTTFCAVAEQRASTFWTSPDGRKWKQQNASSFQHTLGLSCVSSTDCVTVGTPEVDGAADQSSAFTGTSWSAPKAADPPDDGRLKQVDCPTATDCVAVDWDGYTTTMTGKTWSYPQPIPTGKAGSLATPGVMSCPTATFCMFVGGAGYALTLKGSTWSKPVRVTTRNLRFLSCTSATFCLAVDDIAEAFTFNGSAWAKVSGTPKGLSGPVSCVSPTFCLSAAQYLVAPGLTFYNGKTWTTPVSVPTEPDGAEVAGLSCTSTTSCTVVGEGGGAAELVGTTWKAPLAFDGEDGPNWISCVGTAICQVVDTRGRIIPLDNGVPGPATQIEGFNGVLPWISCATAKFCVAVDWSGLAFTGP
jgi:hypothetical protein